MPTVTVHEAKTHLSRLIARAQAGEDIVIARGREPAVRLTPVRTEARPRFGALADLFPPVSDDFFFDPLPDEELDAWDLGASPPPR